MTPANGNPRKFHKGPPPHVGWWNVKFPSFYFADRWSWFDGTGWSGFVGKDDPLRVVRAQANRRGAEYIPKEIVWSDYWPANARVPRIDPEKQVKP